MKKSPLDIANMMGDAAHKKSQAMKKKDAVDEDGAEMEVAPLKPQEPKSDKQKAVIAMKMKMKGKK